MNSSTKAALLIISIFALGIILVASAVIFLRPTDTEEPPTSPIVEVPEEEEGPVCVDQCGDGVCAEIVCLALGCPCAETPASCPQDCSANGSDVDVMNFNDCADAGNPIMESYPRQCRHDGVLFVEHIGNEIEKSDLIRLNNPRPNQVITSPITVTGEARGTWYFEATFPISLVNWDGLIIAEGYATADGDWMTEEFVPFTATLEFETPQVYDRGAIILNKSNASGLPEHDDALEIPIRYAGVE